MNIAILTLIAGDTYKNTVSLATSKKEYCEKHNYTFILGDECIYDKNRPVVKDKAYTKILNRL